MKYKKKNSAPKQYLKKWLIVSCYQILVCAALFLIGKIVLVKYPNMKGVLYHYLYEDHLSFAKVRGWYEDHLAVYLPWEDKEEVEAVFKDHLTYKTLSLYKDGVALELDNPLVPVLENGVVIFKGEKKEYGNTIIVQGEDGISIWYGNLERLDFKLYDYVKKGSFLGNAKDRLYLVFEKDGEFIDYQTVLSKD